MQPASISTAARIVILGLSCGVVTAQSLPTPPGPKFHQWALTPPMGWNSWDCYGAGVWEADVLANANYMEKNLKSRGWNLITIDIQWYEPLAHTTEYRRGAVLETDANGRLLPAPNRFPMTKETRSFKPMANYLHAEGLKFGLHLLRGIPRQAVDQNVPILGTSVHAATQPASISVSLADLGLTGPCKVRDLWAHKDLDTVNTTISASVNSHGAVLYRVSPVQ